MCAMKKGLGRGMEALIPPAIIDNAINIDNNSTDGLKKIPIDSISPNRMQPRSVFDEEKIRELADSIKEQGLIQPLIVAPTANSRYELIAGERRLRASRIAGLTEVPVVIKDVDDEARLSLAIIENIQREDLNPIEEARAYEELIEQFNYTQEDVAKKVGRSRVSIANSLRLLNLPVIIQEDVVIGRYTAGHARAILTLTNLHEQLKLREKIIKEMPTVRDVEKMVQFYGVGAKGKGRRGVPLDTSTNDLVEKLKSALGTKVVLQPKGAGGKVVIDYYSAQDLDRIFNRITR